MHTAISGMPLMNLNFAHGIRWLIPGICIFFLPLLGACATAEKFVIEGSNRKIAWYQRSKTQLPEQEKTKLRSSLRFLAPVSLGLGVGTISTFGKKSSAGESSAKPELLESANKALIAKLGNTSQGKWKLLQKLYRNFFQLGDLRSSRLYSEKAIQELKTLVEPNGDLETLVALSDAHLHLARILPPGNARRRALDAGSKYFETAFGRNADTWSLVNIALGMLQNNDSESLRVLTILSQKLMLDIDKNQDPLGVLVMAVFIDYMNAFPQVTAGKDIQFTKNQAFQLLKLRAEQHQNDNRYLIMVHFFDLFEIFFSAMVCDHDSVMSFEKPITCLSEEKKTRLAAIKKFFSSPAVLKYETADIYNYAAVTAFLSRDFGEAVRLWEKAVQLKPTDSALNGVLAFAYIKRGENPKGLALLESKVRMPEGVTTDDYLRLALVYNDDNKLDQFKNACKKAAQYKNDSPENPIFCLAIASLRLNDTQTAWTLLTSLMANPKIGKGDLAQIHYGRAVILFLHDNPQAAFLELRRAIRANPEKVSPEIMTALDDYFIDGYRIAMEQEDS